jgi:hypothetical protein
VVLAVFAGPSVAQFGAAGGSAYPGLVPSVRPAGAEEPLTSTRPVIPPIPPVPPARPAAMAASLEEMTVPPGPGSGSPADPVGTLTGVPTYPGIPVGSYPSPYYVDGPGCCGPLGKNGRVTYELYTYSGVNIPFGDGLPDRLNAGWTFGGGIRTLFFNPTHDAAWTLDYGLSYTHNWGQGSRDPAFLFVRQGNVERGTLTGIRELHRTSFNFNLGRDVWLLGSATTGTCEGTNCRVGGWVGGRYGTSHVDLNPLDETPQNGYARRQNVFHSFVVGAHATAETPMGGWILFGGMRMEYGYDWMNVVPPIQGNLNNLNIQVTAGIRY